MTALGLAAQEDGGRPWDPDTLAMLHGASFHDTRDWTEAEDEQLFRRLRR